MANPWLDATKAKVWSAGAKPMNPLRPEQIGVVLALAAAKSPKRMLDLGSGPGEIARRLLDRVPDSEIVCLDASSAIPDPSLGPGTS